VNGIAKSEVGIAPVSWLFWRYLSNKNFEFEFSEPEKKRKEKKEKKMNNNIIVFYKYSNFFKFPSSDGIVPVSLLL